MLDGAFRQREYRVEHRLRQFPGEGILLTGMIRANERDVPGKAVDRSMTERGKGRRKHAPLPAARFQIVIKGDFSEDHDHPHFLQQS